MVGIVMLEALEAPSPERFSGNCRWEIGSALRSLKQKGLSKSTSTFEKCVRTLVGECDYARELACGQSQFKSFHFKGVPRAQICVNDSQTCDR